VVDNQGNLLIADTDNNVIRAVAGSTGVYYGQSMVAGNIYTIVGNGTAGNNGVTSPLTQTELSAPTGIAVDAQGDVVITDTGNNSVRLVAATTGTFYGRTMQAGHIYTIATSAAPCTPVNGGDASAACLISVDGVTFDPLGNVIFADVGNDDVMLLPQNAGTFYGQAVTPGLYYIIAGNGTIGFSGKGGPGAQAQLALQTFAGLATDASANLFVADGGDNVVWMVAGSTGTYRGSPVTAGHIYVVVGNGTPGSSGNKKPASTAMLDGPEGVAVDHTGNLLVSDSNNSVVRAVPAAGGRYYGVRMKTPGAIYTIAGNGQPGYSGDSGPARKAEFNVPAGLAVGQPGTLFIADNGNDVIRAIAPRPPSRRHGAATDVVTPDAASLTTGGASSSAAPTFGSVASGSSQVATAAVQAPDNGTAGVTATRLGSGHRRHHLRRLHQSAG
jgi:hypothetical protein